MHADSILGGSPESDDDFRDYVLALVGEGTKAKTRDLSGPVGRGAPEVTHEARLLAQQWIPMARSDTLEELGEHREAQALAERSVRDLIG